jgi:hypothetical protein
MGRRIFDPLRLPFRRGRKCTQAIRQVARGERAFVGLEEALRGTPCGGRGCTQCAEAALRLAEHLGFELGPSGGLAVAKWTSDYVAGIDATERQGYVLRALSLIAQFLRQTDTAMALKILDEAAAHEAMAPVREKADYQRRAAVVLAEGGRLEAARQAVVRARALHEAADEVGLVVDPERGLAAVDAAEMFVEGVAAYSGEPADLARAMRAGERALKTIPVAQAPRSFAAVTANLLAVAVTAWRIGSEAVSGVELVQWLEDRFPGLETASRDAASTNVRWLWTLAVGEQEGYSERVRSRVKYVRSSLIAQGRWRDVVDLEIDVLWMMAYGKGPARRRQMTPVAAGLSRAVRKAALGEEYRSLADRIEEACRDERLIPQEWMSELAGLRALPSARVEVWDVKLTD